MSPLHKTNKLRNRVHSVLLLAAMLLLLLALCTSLFGNNGLLLLLFTLGLSLLFTPRASAWLTLRLYHARQLPFEAAPQLYRIVDQLARKAGLKTHTTLFYIPGRLPNAVAMQERGQPLIAVTDALLRNLDQDEIAAVLAHEISHIRNDDLNVMMLADLLTRLTSVLSTAGWVMLIIFLPLWLLTDTMLPWLAIALLMFAPIASALLQLALSRTREFDADMDAARLTGNPAALARALIKIERGGNGWWNLFLPPRHSPDSWARTHPPTEERVRRLRALAVEQERMSTLSLNLLTPAAMITGPTRLHRAWF